jgi:hypothetical protein
MNDKFKKFAVQLAIQCQDPNDIYYLSNQHNYDKYHEKLEKFFKSNYCKKPTPSDNLAFVLILTYPPKMIYEFNSISDLELFFRGVTHEQTDESDFVSRGCDVRDKDDNTTCICNKHIINVFYVQNKHTGINVNLGCDCIDLYGLISKDDPDYKSCHQQIKLKKEHLKEKAEGLPQGYYEEVTKIKKIQKQAEKEEKERAKELKKLNKTEPGRWISKKCCFCERDSICRTEDKIGICSKCYDENQRKLRRILVNMVRQNIKLQNCGNCENDYINTKNTNPDLCRECSKKYRVGKCKNRSCNNKFVDLVSKNDEYCDKDCEPINCLDCSRTMFKNSNNDVKCYDCLHKLITKICDSCDDEFCVQKKDDWKTICSDCLEKAKCIDCDNSFYRSKEDSWKTRCSKCYRPRPKYK